MEFPVESNIHDLKLSGNLLILSVVNGDILVTRWSEKIPDENLGKFDDKWMLDIRLDYKITGTRKTFLPNQKWIFQEIKPTFFTFCCPSQKYDLK